MVAAADTWRFRIASIDAHLHAHQDAALTAASKWFKAERGKTSIFRLFGYAGTGKTTLARHIAEGIDGKVLYAAFTGKAACVMRSKGCHGASTIHRLIYKPQEKNEENPTFELWSKAPASHASSSSSTNARWSTPSSRAT